jgi:probable addiction module antidote protein
MPRPKVFHSAKNRDNPKSIAKYLNNAFEADRTSDVIYAIGNLARDRGIAFIAEQAGVRREGLYRSLSGDMDPKFGTICKVLKALGMQITIKPRG